MERTDFKETQKPIGYGALLAYKKPSETKYHLLVASEEVPSPASERETFDFNLLQSKTKSKVLGKRDIDDYTMEFLWTLDNVKRLQEIVDEDTPYDFLVVHRNWTAYHFVGELDFRANDASAEVHRGTLKIAIESLDDLIMDARPMLENIVVKTNAVDEEITIPASGQTEFYINTNPDTATLEGSSDNAKVTVTVAGHKVTVKNTNTGGTPVEATVCVKLSATGYGEWKTYIRVTAL